MILTTENASTEKSMKMKKGSIMKQENVLL